MMDQADSDVGASDTETNPESMTSNAAEDDLGIDMNEGTTTTKKSNEQNQEWKKVPGYEFQFLVVESEQVAKDMIESIKKVTSVTELGPTAARMLLNHFKWDADKLMEKYYDSDGGEIVFKEARVAMPTTKTSDNADENRACATDTVTKDEPCLICSLINPAETMMGIECGHKFCSTCWSQYLTTRIMDHGGGQTITCPAYACKTLVDDAIIKKLVEDKKVWSRYQHMITNDFVMCNKLMRWCPGTNCSNAVQVQHPDAKPVRCSCGFEFCFSCGHEWHDPVPCEVLRKWIKKCSDDSETSNWLAVNTKECPKCRATVQKDGGCNHMTCKNQSCKFEYCWLCLGAWQPHGSAWFSCNRFDDAASKAARDAQEHSRAALQRYLHYCNRYMSHMQSLKFESKLYATIKSKMTEMQSQGMSWIEVQFLNKAVDVLVKCRRILMYTYSFAYYVEKTNQSAIFETNQDDLEMATEQLSEFLERDLDKVNLTTLKQMVQDKYRYCENRCEKLLGHCHEGEEKKWWNYVNPNEPWIVPGQQPSVSSK